MAAKSIEAVSNYSTRYHTQRINRRLDDRDNVLKDALAVLEEKDPAVYPTIYKVNPTLANGALTSGSAVCDIEGLNLDTDVSNWVIKVGNVAADVTSGGVTESTGVYTASIELSATLPAAQYDQVLLQIWISDCLATEVFITVA